MYGAWRIKQQPVDAKKIIWPWELSKRWTQIYDTDDDTWEIRWWNTPHNAQIERWHYGQEYYHYGR